MAGNGRVLSTLKLEDYSDRELLLIIDDLAGEDGWVFAVDVGERLGMAEEHRKRAPATRLSWLVRYGAVEREHLADEYGNLRYIRGDPGRPKYGQRWRLTERGRQIALGKLSAAQERALGAINEDALVLATRAIAQRGLESGNDTLETLVKREWRFTTSPLRALNGAR
jgi:hypothetical protein